MRAVSGWLTTFGCCVATWFLLRWVTHNTHRTNLQIVFLSAVIATAATLLYVKLKAGKS